MRKDNKSEKEEEAAADTGQNIPNEATFKKHVLNYKMVISYKSGSGAGTKFLGGI